MANQTKRDRTYLLNISLVDEPIETFLNPLASAIQQKTLPVQLPFTVDFDISRNTLASANTSTIKIYNLSKDHRNSVYKDPFTTSSYKGIELKAGYGGQNATIFKGNINRASSVREGVNWITTIESYDGGFAFVNAETAKAFPKGTPYNSILEHMTSTMPKVSPGATGNFSGSLPRGNSFSGNSADLAHELSGGGFFVDLEKAYYLNNSECIQGNVAEINSGSGLLNTPRKEGTILYVDMLFEPGMLIGQYVKLKTGIDLLGEGHGQFDGPYKVISVHHRGTISAAICGEAVTTVGMWIGTEALSIVNGR